MPVRARRRTHAYVYVIYKMGKDPGPLDPCLASPAALGLGGVQVEDSNPGPLGPLGPLDPFSGNGACMSAFAVVETAGFGPAPSVLSGPLSRLGEASAPLHVKGNFRNRFLASG